MTQGTNKVFELVTHWTLDAQPEELTAIVLDPERIHVWCPSIFMNAALLDRGAADGLGMTIKLHTKGWLPYALYFIAKIVDLEPHRWMMVKVHGDFEGQGRLSIDPRSDGKTCDAKLEWEIQVNQPYLRPFIWLLSPLYRFNHYWAMRQVHRLLQSEILWRRRGAIQTVDEKPTFPHNLGIFRGWSRRTNTDKWI